MQIFGSNILTLILFLGTLRVSKSAIKKHGNIVCAYIPLYRGNNDFSVYEGNRIFPGKKIKLLNFCEKFSKKIFFLSIFKNDHKIFKSFFRIFF
jgi:hypothetical protein